MFKLFSLFSKKNSFWNFNKKKFLEIKNESNRVTYLLKIPLPKYFILPITNKLLDKEEIKKIFCIKKGDYVLRGHPLVSNYNKHVLPIHAPTSGKIISINSYYPHPEDRDAANYCIIIQADGKDRWMIRSSWRNYQELPREKLVNRIYQYGICDFKDKVNLFINSEEKSERNTLIINATESETYITADYQIIQDSVTQIIEGIEILKYIIQPLKIIIVIENNKRLAISKLDIALKNSHNCDINLYIIQNKLSSKSEKQLIKIITGQKIPYNKSLLDAGIVMYNVSTVYAIKRAIVDGEPMTERIVTLMGQSISLPGNVLVRLGTTVHYLLEKSGFCPEKDQTVIMNGLLVGFTLPWLNIPIMKTTNCIIAPTKKELHWIQKKRNCIRCGICSDVCPQNLLPQQLYFYIKNNQHDRIRSDYINKCIECGACAEVCPSAIPLVQYFRQKKVEDYIFSIKRKRAKEAKVRFEAKKNRLVEKKKIHPNKNYNQISIHSEDVNEKKSNN